MFSFFIHPVYGLATVSNSLNCIPPADVTEYLAEQLQKAFIRPWQNICPTDVPDLQIASHLLKDVPPPLSATGQVKCTLRHINPKKATGVDGVPAWLLKRFNEELALVVHKIMCASIIQCKYPKPYKHALTCPVPKVNPPNNIDSDFPQISGSSISGESTGKTSIFLQIGNNQHAFIQNRSTVSALTLFLRSDLMQLTTHACVRACVRVCVRACVYLCMNQEQYVE